MAEPQAPIYGAPLLEATGALAPVPGARIGM